MDALQSLLERNKQIAAEQAAEGKLQPSLPVALQHVKTIIIGCADMRVDPANLFKLEPGEAVVLRNIGGRVTPGLLEQLAMLGSIGKVAGQVPGGGDAFNVVVLQHTDCGITRLADEPALLTRYFQSETSQLDSKTLLDPRAAVAADVATLRAVSAFPDSWLLSGLVYDVATGQLEVVVPPKPVAQ